MPHRYRVEPNNGNANRNTLVVCGPTACGKSDLSDLAADLLSERLPGYAPVVVVDSMQVYKEIPTITNQHRRRPADLVGVVSVTEEWTMARHRRACDEITKGTNMPFILDAGTGMYLNAILLDIPIAPRVPMRARKKAESLSADKVNPRRAAREKELAISGAEPRGSIWDGVLRYRADMIYLRPKKAELDPAIAERSSRITRDGLAEAIDLMEEFPDGVPNDSVRDSIGVKELVSHLRGKVSLEEAEQGILTRTRRLSRKQIRWFDKLTKSLEGKANIRVLEDTHNAEKTVQEFADRVQRYYA